MTRRQGEAPDVSQTDSWPVALSGAQAKWTFSGILFTEFHVGQVQGNKPQRFICRCLSRAHLASQHHA